MEVNLIEKSLELMIVGMGMTFLFLIVLVYIMGGLKNSTSFLFLCLSSKSTAW
jgi:Na+-transporting methylmalonyl-CoA/oxaloacetate decarboxylase gamma subunit